MPIAVTASTASMTLPGPTGSPAARKVRAKCIRLASSDPPSSDVAAMASASAANSPHPPVAAAPGPSLSRIAGEGAERSEAGEGIGGTTSVCCMGGGFGLDLLEQPGGFAAVQTGDVVLV